MFDFPYLRPSEYFPSCLMHKGLRVVISRRFKESNSIFDIKVIDFDEETAVGVGNNPDIKDAYQNKYWFYYFEIKTVRGSIDWNIDHMFVSCSERVLLGEPIGYFCRELILRPLHYGYGFYAESECFADKSKIKMYEIPLKDLHQADQSIESLLAGLSKRRFIRQNNGRFLKIDKEDEKFPEGSIYPIRFETGFFHPS